MAYGYPSYYNPYQPYQPPMPDQLAQLRAGQYQPQPLQNMQQPPTDGVGSRWAGGIRVPGSSQ